VHSNFYGKPFAAGKAISLFFIKPLLTLKKVTPMKAEEDEITGETIKGRARQVSFPAKVEAKDGIVNATGKLIIDRTDWNIRYKSGSS
jgi:hypothetical protein